MSSAVAGLYRHLARGLDKSQALRRAKLDYLLTGAVGTVKEIDARCELERRVLVCSKRPKA